MITKDEIKKVAIIAGSGALPRHVYDGCLKQGLEPMLIGLSSNTEVERFPEVELEIFPMHAVSKVLKKMRDGGVSHVVFAGKVKRSSLSKLLLDSKGARLLANIMKAGLNDNSLLVTILEFFEKEGFTVISPEKIATDIVVKKGKLTQCEPTKEHWRDIKKGQEILRGIASYDVGQALIIQSGLVLGVEAAEGTDELIKRCGSIMNPEESGGILVKACKPKQDKRVDLPCIGLQTIHNLHGNGLVGVAIEAGAALMLDEQKTLEEADKLGIFIYGI